MRTNEINYHLDHELCEIFEITIDDLDKIELGVVEVMRELLFKRWLNLWLQVGE